MRYANAAERLLAAIGEPQMIDTAKDARLEFVGRMVGRGYTERQVRRLVEWYMRVKQAG
jgi:predicted Ser/Thr protein kinase